MDPPRGIVSSNGLVIVIVSHVRYQTFLFASKVYLRLEEACEGLPEIWTGVKNRQEEATKTGGERQQLWVWHYGLDHTDHRGHSHENILLSVYLINAT